MQELKCAICGEGQSAEILYKENFDYANINEETFSARRLPEKVHYRLLRCNGCGLVYSSPILDPGEIENLYKRSRLTYGAELENLKETYGHYLKKIMDVTPARGNILEIGCGNGFFLEKALELGFKKAFGVEPSKNAIEKADASLKANIVNDIFRPGMFEGDLFDVVCFFQTIDHIVDPNEFLRACRAVLKPGGIVFCISHNTKAFSTKILGESSPIFDIEHIYLFNTGTIREIFEKNGFKVIDVFGIKNSYSLGYWTRMLPFPQFLKKNILTLLGLLGLDTRRVTLTSGNIGIVAVR